MKGKQITNVKELIAFLQQYPSDTDIFHLTGNKSSGTESHSLFILETNPIGDRDMEEIITLSFANNSNPFGS